MSDYINPLPETSKPINQVEVKVDGQKTPQRITIKYQTTGIFQDISEEDKVEP
jgi:hypothetical protein